METWCKSIRRVVGVDFSGAKEAGENIWLATVELGASGAVSGRSLVELVRLADVVGSSEREVALGGLVEMIRESAGSARAAGSTLWAMDFPFGLPVELFGRGVGWGGMLKEVMEWKGTAGDFGRECVARAVRHSGKMHIRRETDVAARTPFDCYHYRIIHQTVWGMRMLGQLRGSAGVAILPFEYAKVDEAGAVVVEACPGSTLRRLGWPYQNYKQPTGGPLTAKRLATRRKIMDGLRKEVAMTEGQVRVMMRNPGGDALDAVIAAVGVGQSFFGVDHRGIAGNSRWVREGWVYF
jgi:hypothetical protein